MFGTVWHHPAMGGCGWLCPSRGQFSANPYPVSIQRERNGTDLPKLVSLICRTVSRSQCVVRATPIIRQA
jgi:hypothetical protein